MRIIQISAMVAACVIAPVSASAQRVGFERTIDVTGPVSLNVTTDRGRIEVVAGEAGRVVIEGDATVRVGWDVPSNAPEIARRVAAAPPITHEGAVVRLDVPVDRTAQRAVTVSYRVRVPPGAEVRSISDSGATSIVGISAPVDVRTQSATIELINLAGPVDASTGSGDVTADRIAGALSVTTSSSAFRGTGLASSATVRTGSGVVTLGMEGDAGVDVDTRSGAITVRGARGGLTLVTQSGALIVQGAPGDNWAMTTGSSSVRVDVESDTGFELDASSRSGAVTLQGISVVGVVDQRAARGAVSGGGPTVRIRTGSGAIRLSRVSSRP